ncbi:MAG: carbohydrate kinase family protein [Ignavibacteria bacterium]|nr:carbohydrate kinase family protein [Ignavibacteria bacterium]
MIKKYVCAIGGINVDVKGIASGMSADSHPGKIIITEGGVARNISENLARMNVNISLFGCIGKDEFGNRILESARKSGIRTDYLLVSSDINTAVYLSVADDKGKMNYAVNDMSDSINTVNEDYINVHYDFISKCGMIVLDSNLNINVLNKIIGIANNSGIPVFLDAVSEDKGINVRIISGLIDYLSVNSSEFESIFGASADSEEKEKYITKNIKNIVIRKGKNGAELYNAEIAKTYKCKPLSVNVAEPNGAGDAFNAGFIYSFLNNYGIDDSLVFGTCASYFALRSNRTVPDDVTEDKLVKLFRESKSILM